MKICNHCQAENADEMLTCCSCGEAFEEEPIVEPAPAAEEEEFPLETDEKEKKSYTGLIILIVLAVLLVASLFIAKSAYDKAQAEKAAQEQIQEPAQEPADAAPEEEAPQSAATVTQGAHHTNAHGYGSHSIHFTVDESGVFTYDYQDADGSNVSLTEAEVTALLDQTVATAAGQTLTNREMMYYFDEEFYAFYSQYYTYLAMLLDTTQPLDEQPSFDGATTWQQSFLQAGISSFHEVAALYAQAQEEGFTLPETDQGMVDSMLTQLEDVAVSYGYDSPEAYLKEYYGPAASLESYLAFFELNYFCNVYLNQIATGIEITDEELVEYYETNSEMLLTNYGLEMIDQPMVNVRHILITPESTTAEDGTSSISDEAWATAKAEAEALLNQWQSGDATEDSFAALAEEHTDDPGSSTTGGLYEGVYPGQMVTEFNDWCFDASRKAGDTAIVQTTYGYHIMYFSSATEEIYWRTAVDELIRSEAVSSLLSELMAAYPMEADYSKAILLVGTANTLPSTEEETTADGNVGGEIFDE